MELVLTGNKMSAQDAERSGLVARVFPTEKLLEETIKVADKIAGLSLPVVMMAKEGVNKAFEMSLTEGLNYERLMFHSTFAIVSFSRLTLSLLLSLSLSLSLSLLSVEHNYNPPLVLLTRT